MPAYNEVYNWVKEYGHSGIPDQRAVGDFVACENDERIVRFKSQLHGISTGNYDIDLFDKLIGKNRRTRHGSYEAWAKMMLLWVNESYKRA